ncbi:hypothetical protein N7540_011092 [Penicillium herquei]|nr:hypothetical protein N7540_011092 [Penicillium herquei]
MAVQASPLSELAELHLELRKFPHLFELSSEVDIYLTPTHTGLQADCANIFFKTSFLTPSEIFFALLLRPDVEPNAQYALFFVIDRFKGDRFHKKEPEGLTKIVKSLRKPVSVLLTDISPTRIPAILASVTPTYDGQVIPINWVAEFSEISESGITREIKAPLWILSCYFEISEYLSGIHQ